MPDREKPSSKQKNVEATCKPLMPAIPQIWRSSPNQRLVVEIPDGNVSITAAREAHLGIWADGQGIAGRGGGGQFCLDSGGGGSQIPNGEGAGLSPHNKCAPIWKEFAGTDVVVPVLEREIAIAMKMRAGLLRKAGRAPFQLYWENSSWKKEDKYEILARLRGPKLA